MPVSGFQLGRQHRVRAEFDAEGYELPGKTDITRTSSKILTRDEVKAHLNIDAAETHEDSYIDSLLGVVTNAIEKAVNHKVVRTTADFHYTGRTGKFKVISQSIHQFTRVNLRESRLSGSGTPYIHTASEIVSANLLTNNWTQYEPLAIATIEQYPDFTEITDYVSGSDLDYPAVLTAEIGYDPTPADMKHAALMVAADLFDNRGQFNLSMAGSNLTNGIIASGILDQYRKQYTGMMI